MLEIRLPLIEFKKVINGQIQNNCSICRPFLDFYDQLHEMVPITVLQVNLSVKSKHAMTSSGAVKSSGKSGSAAVQVVRYNPGFAIGRLENFLYQPRSKWMHLSNPGKKNAAKEEIMGPAFHLLCPRYSGPLTPLSLWLLGSLSTCPAKNQAGGGTS